MTRRPSPREIRTPFVACHLGLWLDLPTVGCVKPQQIQSVARHWSSTVRWWSAASRASTGLRVAGMCRIDVASAAAVVLAGAGGYQVPEPLRRANILTRTLRKAASAHGELALGDATG